MKLNPDCIRDIMFELEDILLIDASLGFSGAIIEMLFTELPNYNQEDIFYSVYMLLQAGYIEGEITFLPSGAKKTCNIKTLTWEGHEFLETIRPDSTWQKIKEYLAAVGGKSIHAIKFIGVKLLEAKINTIL